MSSTLFSSCDLFVFDFDGTIMNTEPIHYQCYLQAILNYQHKYSQEDVIHKEFTYDIYLQYAHSIDLHDMENYLKYHFHISKHMYKIIYQEKQRLYSEYIKNQDVLDYCEGMESFIQQIISHQKDFVIVTNTSKKNIHIILSHPKFHLLQSVTKIYTKEDFFHKKPYSECYIKVCNDFPHHSCKIGFEDSIRGFHSLYHSQSIYPIFLSSPHYLSIFSFESDSYPHHQHFHSIPHFLSNFEIESIPENFFVYNQYPIQNMIEIYQSQMEQNKKIMIETVFQISIFLKEQLQRKQSNIYLTGMGKSGYICKKSASTWQSLSIPCKYLDLPNLPHGDFGTLQKNDIILFISNSGNTPEILFILQYLQQHFHNEIFTISIIGNPNGKMRDLSHFTYILNEIQEADEINMAPSVSSSIYMMILDMIGIHVSSGITKEQFKKNHPSGALGQK
jgi:D-arabinose 5-phosphate isomerase GutQ/beta-phosphoglucomutase-like phosphatase (HAD superfamily)